MTGASDRSSRGRERIAIGVTAGTLLLFEIAITRITSAVLYYHFVFVALSLAMLGLSLPGVWYTLRPPGKRALPISLLLAGISLPVAVVSIFKLGGSVFLEGDTLGLLGLLVLGSALIPFLALGSVICLLLLGAKGKRIGAMYGSDLLGSTVGAALVVPLMRIAPTPLLIATAGCLPLIALGLLYRKYRIGALIFGSLILGSVVWGTPYELRFNRVYQEDVEPLFERWTPTGRITVLPWGDDEQASGVFGWGWGHQYEGQFGDQLMVHQEGGAGTPIMFLEQWPSDLDFLLYDVTTAALQFESPENVVVIGAGGGRDVLASLQAGASRVDAVELNREIVRAASEVFAAFSGDPYHLPGVRAVVAEGRHFLTYADSDLDLIMISLVDSWAATAAGAYALAENYLYTLEALRLYLQRVKPAGLVSITRWYGTDQRLETIRLALVALEALEREGAEDPRGHLVIVQAGTVASAVFSPTAFDSERLDVVDAVCQARGFVRLWPPVEGVPINPLGAVLLEETRPTRLGDFDVSPPTDDRPFFFQNVSPFRITAPEQVVGLSFNERSTSLVRSMTLGLGALTLLLIATATIGQRRSRRLGSLRGSAYFAAIGVAFMLVELPLIQRFILYLGHPSYATTVVIAAILLGAGVGAAVTGRVPAQVIVRYSLALPLAVCLVTIGLAPLFQAALGAPLAVRIVTSLALLTPLGFLMGFAFPFGMIRFGDPGRAWFWAVNGTTSVLGSVLALGLAMEFGFTLVLFTGAVCYAVAALLLRTRQ